MIIVCVGVYLNCVFFVVFDCGIDNEDLLNDDLYLGLKKKRVRGEKYDEFVDMFVKSVMELYFKVYIYFEDFGLMNGMFFFLIFDSVSREWREIFGGLFDGE